MDTVRTFLYIALGLSIFMLWNAWEHDYAVNITAQHKTASSVSATHTQGNSSASIAGSPNTANSTAISGKGEIINVHTSVQNVKIDTANGVILSTSLPKYAASLKQQNVPLVILNSHPAEKYVSQSGLMSKAGKEVPVLYTSAQKTYTMATSQKELTVNLTGKAANGLMVTKQFIFEKGKYDIKINYILKNASGKTWQGNIFTQLTRKWPLPHKKKGLFHEMTSYTGSALSTKSNVYEKYSFSDLKDSNINATSKGGWSAMVEQYFLSVWIPASSSVNHYYSRVNNGLYTIGSYGPNLSIAPKQSITQNYKLYVGPKVMSVLKTIAPGLDHTIDYGWLWFISILIFWMMKNIYAVIGNWGWSIILVTVFIKLVFYKLSATSYRSMARMRNLQPKLTALKERFADDKQAFSKAMMELYRKEKVNPLGGCLPMVIQIPVFIALYWVLLESVQLRQAPFMFWIHDLAAPDPFYVLPVLMGITFFIQQKLSPPPPDPMQAKLMMALPIVFTVLFLNMPAGLMLYWVASNTLSILQQWHVMRTVNNEVSKGKSHNKNKSKPSLLGIIKR